MRVKDKAKLIISLDTELLWGYVDFPLDKMVTLIKEDKTKGRENIKFLLDIFERYNIPCTWAMVGHLLLDQIEHENELSTQTRSNYLKDRFHNSSYYSSIKEDPLYCGKDILDMILNSRIEHEIGYHSFSHVDFSKCSNIVAEKEIQHGVSIAEKYSINLKSFSFPNNKIGHIDTLKKYGFSVFRGQTILKAQLDQNYFVRLFNSSIDKIISYPTEPIWLDGIWEIPGSMFFGDTTFKYSVLTKAKLGVNRAISSESIFHVYLHPHDLLLYNSLKSDLEKFLGFVAKKRDDGKIEILTMGEAVNCFSI